MNDLWEHLQGMGKLCVELDMDQVMDIEAVEWAVRYITEQVDPNKLLCRELDESQRVVEARDERIEKLEDKLKTQEGHVHALESDLYELSGEQE